MKVEIFLTFSFLPALGLCDLSANSTAMMVTALAKELDIDIIDFRLTAGTREFARILRKSLQMSLTISPQPSKERSGHLPVFTINVEPDSGSLGIDCHETHAWLLLVTEEELRNVDQFFAESQLCLVSRVFLFRAFNDSYFELFESYRIEAGSEIILERYAVWNGTDLELRTPKDIWERRADLRGVELKIAVLPSQPYLELTCGTSVEQRNNCSMSGMFPEVFFILQSILNFTFVFHQPEDGNWGNKVENASGTFWNGMIGQLQRREIDLAPTSFSVINARSLVVDFAEGITDVHHRFFVKNPKNGYNWTAYTDPLSSQIWRVIGILCLTMPIFFWAVVFFSSGREYKIFESYGFVVGALTFARPWNPVPTSLLAKNLFLLIMCAGTLIYYHWEAMLISFLAVQKKVLPFTTIEELMQISLFK